MPEIAELAVAIAGYQQCAKILEATPFAFGESADNEFLLWSSFDL